MSDTSPPPARPAASVRLEVRVGGGRPAVYEVGDGGFLIGSVPGCDLRLPGTNLPPVLCLVARQPGGASLRKLAPVQPITLNGRPSSSTYLADGDRVGVGAAELVVAITLQEEAAPATPPPQGEDRLRQIEAREQALRVEAERAARHAERQATDGRGGEQSALLAELRGRVERLGKDLHASRGELESRDETCRRLQAEFARKEADLQARVADLEKREGAAGDGDAQGRERLLMRQQALHKAARKIHRRKRDLDERQAKIDELEREWQTRQAELESRAGQLDRDRLALDEQRGAFSTQEQEFRRVSSARLAEVIGRETAVATAEGALKQGQEQHQSDLLRLDRIQAGVETRQKQIEARALEYDRKAEQLRLDTRDLEEQAARLDEQHVRLTAEREEIDAARKLTETKAADVEQRAAALEGQQTMLATLRTRLERMREELHRQEQALSDQRVLQEAGEADLATRRAEAEQLRVALANDRDSFDQERRRFDERRATLEQAVAQLRQAQASLTLAQAEIESQQTAADATAAEQAELGASLQARTEQLEQLTSRLQADRLSVAERQSGLAKAEQTLAALQEQVRRRGEECEARQQDIEARAARLAVREEETAARQAEIERTAAELGARASGVEGQSASLAQQEQALKLARQEVAQTQASLLARTESLAADRVAWEAERQAAQDEQRRLEEEFRQTREEAQALVGQLPELELRAKSTQQAMERAREQLREQLGEIHAYSRQSRDELEAARKHTQSEQDRLRQQELELHAARDEHRLAVAAFRQQMIEWQGRVGDMRQTLLSDNSRLEMRARQMEDAGARLAQETESLERQKRQVAERRGEIDRHLSDMREWYRRKIRELAGVDAPPGVPGEGDVLPLPASLSAKAPAGDRDPARAVLTLDDDLEPADRELGVMLATLGLIDDDTRQALWSEARRQRRSLRQLLLAGGYLTLYQLALIEAGNLDGLVLGPVRVIDKLSSGPREAVYRVFDPRRNAEAVLRHLAEAEMHDAVRPDEFRQRFLAASAVQHDLIAGVLEVLTIADRPAALVEWVDGVPASDLSGHAAAPAVWFRLVTQAAAALHIAHGMGLSHGRIDGNALGLTPRGVLKLVGLGEPRWLVGADEAEDSPAGDLWALGQLAAAWAAPAPGTRPGKGKTLPEPLTVILDRLQADDPANRFASAQDVLAALEAAGPSLPAGTTAWDRLLKQTREQVGGPARRQSA